MVVIPCAKHNMIRFLEMYMKVFHLGCLPSIYLERTEIMKRINILYLVFIVSVILCAFPTKTQAWYSDPKINSHIAPTPQNQIDHSAISDGLGGAMITWAQNVDVNDKEFDIYAQRLDSHGESVWNAPVAVCSANNFQGLPQIVGDDVGGAIIVWHDSRQGWSDTFSNFDIYIQRIDKDGNILWTPDGLSVCDASEWQIYPKIAADGMGGAVVTWDDGRSGNSQVYVQHIDANGIFIWPDNGILVADIPFGQSDPHIVGDGFGGAIVVWADFRQLGNIDVYAQRIDAQGNRKWGLQGIGLATVDGEQFGGRVIMDGAGGGIFAWTDGRNGENEFDIYAQRVEPNGTISWAHQGSPICEESGSQVLPALIPDGLGGAIIAWEDGRKQNNDTDIYVQRISAQGVLVWNVGGAEVAVSDEAQTHIAILPDGSGGTFLTWMDFYRGGTWWNIYAQHIDGGGQPKWIANGIPVTIADGTQSNPVIVSGESGGSIIFWCDSRNSANFNIYAQMVNRNGFLGGGEFKFYTADKHGNPQSSFPLENLVQFKTTWVMPAPSEAGNYTATSAMSINSSTEFRQQLIDYEVVDNNVDPNS